MGLLKSNAYASPEREAVRTTTKALLQVEEVKLLTKKYGDLAKQYISPQTTTIGLFVYSLAGEKRISTTKFRKFRYHRENVVIRPQIDYYLDGQYTVSVSFSFDF